ncbi:MAG TPA: NUDIX domain-containing protein [Gammaproteobacteria bacterium]|jgi:NADH pyrophosphatase NudC (nudix superfamily)
MKRAEAHRFCPRCGGALRLRDIGGSERSVCADDACGYVFWNNPVPVVAALVEHDGAIVLANNRDWPDHLFGLITGFLERRESPEAAVLREVHEELGLAGRIESLIGLYPFEQMNQIIIAFHVRAEGSIRLGEELRAVKRVEPAKLRPWDFGTGLAVRDWLKANVK